MSGSRQSSAARDLVLDVISQASHLPRASIAVQTSLRELGFDSLRHFQLMLEIESIMGGEFGDDEADAILCCATVDDLCGIVSDFVAERAQSGSLADRPART